MKKIKNHTVELLSDNWYILRKHTFERQLQDGTWVKQIREAYDRGNGAAILLYNKERGTVLLTRQFRLPTYINGNPDGMMIEVCAGLLDEDDPDECIRRETEEETGYRIDVVEKVMETYMSPGAVTEILHLYLAEYHANQKVSEGGGLEEEMEDIEVLEYSMEDALNLVKDGTIKDAKTILLLQYARLNQVL